MTNQDAMNAALAFTVKFVEMSRSEYSAEANKLASFYAKNIKKFNKHDFMMVCAIPVINAN